MSGNLTYINLTRFVELVGIILYYIILYIYWCWGKPSSAE